MRNTQVLCIDFGSAYTKVAVRAGWKKSARLIQQVPLAPNDETSFCIPSVVARVERPGGVRWAVGEAAARMKEGTGVNICRGWKARLQSDQSTDQDYEVGVKFFKEIKDTLRKMNIGIDVRNCPVRLCIPKLGRSAEARQRMLDVLSEAGLHLADGSETVYEPEANAIGVLSRGRNWTWHPPQSSGHFPYNRRIFDPDGLFEAFHQAALARKYVNYGVLVIDVGAFTTDFGYVKFSNKYHKDDMQPPDVVQLSRELGVEKLDREVLDALRPEVQHAIARQPLSAWESKKRRLYNKEPQAVPNPKGSMFKIGEGAEAAMIADLIKKFADRVVRARNAFCRDNVEGHIDVEVLTGGGTMIPLVRKALVKAMKADPGTKVIDLLDVPSQVRLWKEGTWGWYAGAKEIELEVRQSRELVRAGSAIGGCSVFFESP
jgi:hypothetical protein